MRKISRTDEMIAGAAAGALLGFVLWFGLGIWMVRNSPDGQAGMGAALGAVLFGGPLGTLVGGGVGYWRWRRRKIS